ncbi:Hint domain-containing protein [Pseudooceanicola sp. LIPI14-2-Ac024]|uniref:Hint domain-containing protein n=1 Tax=Pseudooceanicola sp. LIPI14-2-Ac024 TaxID=3344875 RepID=UPI0035CF9CD9
MTPTGPTAAISAQPTRQKVAGIVAGSPVLTLDGELPVEFLTPGDRVITRTGGMAVLREVRVRHLRSRAVQVAAGSIGHDRPEADLVLPAEQKVLVRDWRARAIFGQPEALVEVARLADGQFVRGIGELEMTLFELVFDRPHVIYVGGMELAAGTQVQEAA